METWLVIIGLVSVVLCLYLYSKRKSAQDCADGEQDEDAAYDAGAYSEPDENDDADSETDEINDDTEDEEFEYDDVAPFIEETASVIDMRMEPRVLSHGRLLNGRVRDRRELLIFLVDFKMKNGDVRTLSVPPEAYDLISIGERAKLMTQNNRFIDFGDKCAKLAETADDDGQTEKLVYDEYDGDSDELIVGEGEDEPDNNEDMPDEENCVPDEEFADDEPFTTQKKKPVKKVKGGK